MSKGKVVLAIPTITKPYPQCLDSMEASIAPIKEAGWELGVGTEIGNPYISCARSTMLRKAMDAKADVVVFIDHDLSFPPAAILRLIEAEGDVVAGTYRFKHDEVKYMGEVQPDIHARPQVREDGCVRAFSIPAGFLKITREGIARFMRAYPELCYGDPIAPSVDLFNHGAHDGIWYGEDYAFARRWKERCGEIWILPDIDITHWAMEVKPDKSVEYVPFPGNFHRYLRSLPCGSESDNPEKPPESKGTAIPQLWAAA